METFYIQQKRNELDIKEMSGAQEMEKTWSKVCQKKKVDPRKVVECIQQGKYKTFVDNSIANYT